MVKDNYSAVLYYNICKLNFSLSNQLGIKNSELGIKGWATPTPNYIFIFSGAGVPPTIPNS